MAASDEPWNPFAAIARSADCSTRSLAAAVRAAFRIGRLEFVMPTP
jgi:hypothetical protein